MPEVKPNKPIVMEINDRYIVFKPTIDSKSEE